MVRTRFARTAVAMLFLLMAAPVCFGQTEQGDKEFAPQVGQEGKDVIWVPTPQVLVDRMLDMAKVTKKDFVIDLGSGDGRTVITAAKRGARALGIEYNPEMVALSQRNAAEAGVADRATFIRADLFKTDFSRATVLTMFLLPEINLKLRPRILKMKPGTRVVSNSFDMESWRPDRTSEIDSAEKCPAWCTAHLWIVPARVQGVWKLPEGELNLTQQFQMLSGSLKSGSSTTEITKGRMTGSLISFTAGAATYRGRVTAKGIEGTVKSGNTKGKWSAVRAAAPAR